MPQLDILTFSNSYIWFLIVFFGFFYVFSIFLLPSVYFVFRVREKYYDELYLIDKFVSDFNKGMSKMELAGSESILFETAAGFRRLRAPKLAANSLRSYGTILEALLNGCNSKTISQQYIFYVLAYSVLIPTFSTVVMLVSNYADLLDAEH